jgi:precorrin-3B synthase
VTVEIPLGDTNAAELVLLADLADRLGDGSLILDRDQDVVIRNVAVADVDLIRDAVAVHGLVLRGEGPVAAVRACTGSSVCRHRVGREQGPRRWDHSDRIPHLPRRGARSSAGR